MAPRPPAAAKRLTLRSAMRTPEQNPYFSARLTLICRLNASYDRNILKAVRGPRGADTMPHDRARATAYPPLRRSVAVRLRHLLLGVSTAAGDPFSHPRSGRIEGPGGMVSLRLHVRQRVRRAAAGQ